MSRPRTSIANHLAAAQLAINNTLADDEIKNLVSVYGYNDARLAEGSALLAAAQSAVDAQTAATGAQRSATESAAGAQSEAVNAYQALAKVARATHNPAALAGLGLSGKMPRSTAGFLTAAATLFNNAISLPTLAQFGYDTPRLATELTHIEAYRLANERQEAAKGALQQSTRQQDAALASLNLWVAQYRKIARVALGAKPELLEKLGVTHRARPTAAQRAAHKTT